jgi:aspartate 1-decarboxylase
MTSTTPVKWRAPTVIIAYAQMDEAEARTFVPRVVFVDHDNHIVDIGGDPALVPDGFGLQMSGTPRR